MVVVYTEYIACSLIKSVRLPRAYIRESLIDFLLRQDEVVRMGLRRLLDKDGVGHTKVNPLTTLCYFTGVLSIET